MAEYEILWNDGRKTRTGASHVEFDPGWVRLLDRNSQVVLAVRDDAVTAIRRVEVRTDESQAVQA